MTDSNRSLGVSATGLDPQVAAMLSYLAMWVTGVVFLLLERENRFVRFHAMQSVIGLGTLWAIGLLCWIASFPMALVSTGAFRALIVTAMAIWAACVLVWVICLLKAYSGERYKLPIAGALAERWVERA